jgi:RHS repeat-associated protein
VTAIADSGGNVQERYGYDAFGLPGVFTATFALRSRTLWDWETRYAGYRWDAESGLYYVRHRLYHAAIGGWLQRDPFQRLIDFNLYHYCQGNPTTFSDPTGEQGDEALVLGGAAVAEAGEAAGAAGGVSALALTLEVAIPVAVFIAACGIGHYQYVKRQAGKVWTNDKWAHCVVSCRIAKTCGTYVSWPGGWSFERLQDLLHYLGLRARGGDKEDEKANHAGLDCAGWESWIAPIGSIIGWFFRDSCADCCTVEKQYDPMIHGTIGMVTGRKGMIKCPKRRLVM